MSTCAPGVIKLNNNTHSLHFETGLKFWSDQEGGIKTAKFQNMLQKYGVCLAFSYSPTKASLAKIAIRTIKRRLYKYMKYSRDINYEPIVHSLIASYNRTPHSSLHGYSPKTILLSRDAQYALLEYQQPARMEGTIDTFDYDSQRKRLPPIGSFVRLLIPKSKRLFQKEVAATESTYSQSIYQVVAYQYTHPPSIRVRVMEVGSSKILPRAYYADELIPTSYNPDQYFLIEKVLRKRKGAGGTRQLLVKFKGYKGFQS